jgi:hypothetical protein
MGLAPVRALRRFRPIGMRARLLFILAVCFVEPAHAGSCVAQSGPDSVPLVELYTAKNCAGCARAELWLSELKAHRPQSVLPVVLPMEDRDNGGEPKGQPSRKLTVLQRIALIYRPYVLLQGHEFPGWNTDAFDAALARIRARPAGVRLRLEIVSRSADRIDVAAEADSQAALYLAAYGTGPESVPLVREWQGPFAVNSGARVRRTLAVPPGVASNSSGVVGFAQDPRSAEVLQALRLPAC